MIGEKSGIISYSRMESQKLIIIVYYYITSHSRPYEQNTDHSEMPLQYFLVLENLLGITKAF
jgi:hypothetical protein